MKKDSNLEEIKKLIRQDQFIISNHARMRMFQRNVTTNSIKEIIIHGEIIENYHNDFPCPSVLILGFEKQEPWHIVAARCLDHVRIITVYEPDEKKWNNFRKRKV